MSATIKYVGGPKDGQMEHAKGVPDHISFKDGVYWLKTFKGRSAVMSWEPHEGPATQPLFCPISPP